ncbi:MAG: gamma-glutamylcyclotransferase family protein [Neptuniibacter sp.]
MISVVGYGSLLSEQSARETVPALQNFRIVRVPGYRRIFNKVGIVFLSRHGADPASLELASCSTLPDPHSEIICSQFECTEADFRMLYEREHRFEWVDVETIESTRLISSGRVCTTSTDDYYRHRKCQSSQEYHERVGQHYPGKIWRSDILPFPRYLAFCLQAAQGQGTEVLNNFLDSSYIADGQTTIRKYIASHPQLQDWRSIDCGYSYHSR